MAADVSEEAVKILAELKAPNLAQLVQNAVARYPSMAEVLTRTAQHDPVRDLWDEGKVSWWKNVDLNNNEKKGLAHVRAKGSCAGTRAFCKAVPRRTQGFLGACSLRRLLLVGRQTPDRSHFNFDCSKGS